MRKSGTKVFGSALTVALLAVPFAPVASAAPPAEGAEHVAHEHDRPDPASDARRALNQKAVELVAKGQRKVEDRGGSKAVRIAPGQYAQYGVQESDRLLTFLVEFGDKKDARFQDMPAGPLHNQITQPDRSKDNSTYWTEDFSRQHFQDMFFGTEGESFAGVYEELSSGRYEVTGDTSDWVKVPYHSASYGETESHTDMTRFIQDSANAWYDAEVAKGKTPAQINEYLSTFDEWDRYDYDKDGDFSEADGYIDHFQAVRAGEDESAGAPSWMIWAHRWAVGQTGRGTTGPSFNKYGGVKVGQSDFWIRDYTTEPENGGLGVFAHEYAHDLGLPDLYDTSGGENGTGFWTLMSSGSWLGDGAGDIGTTPNHMGAWEKLQLGWLDYTKVKAGQKSTVNLGPAEHATKRSQALLVELPNDAAGKSRFYIAENRQYLGLDTTLQQGPYNFGWGTTAPDKVEHFPYQDGLLISYWNTARPRNTVRNHPGEGLVLPVDARPKALTWSDGFLVRNRIQTFDATFGTEATDPVTLHRETAKGMTTVTVPSSKAVPVFDDTDPNAYYDPANPLGSVKVAGTGTRIEVVQSNKQGMMTVQVE